jgi:hypothetical protein
MVRFQVLCSLACFKCDDKIEGLFTEVKIGLCLKNIINVARVC